MNQPQSVLLKEGLTPVKNVGWVANTPHLDQNITVSLEQRKRHELTPEEAKGGFIMGVTIHMVLHFP